MAELQTMTIPQRRLVADDPTPFVSPELTVTEAASVFIRPTSTEWADPAKAGGIVNVISERWDGVTLAGGQPDWRHSCSASLVIGSAGKDGGLPPMSCSFAGGPGVKARFRVTTDTTIRVGAQVTVS